MTFPMTIEEALALPSEEALNYLELLIDRLDEKLFDYEPPANVSLACLIYSLEKFNELDDHPFGTGGWQELILEQDE
jgi:hypothetical protein